MRILLVVPRTLNPKQTYREYPLGVGMIGTLLAQRGHEVEIFDQSVEEPGDHMLLRRVATFAPNVIGFSVITPNYPVARKQIHDIKRIHPDIFLVAGGVHSSLFPEDLLLDGIDVVVLGEGELLMPELLQRIDTASNYDGLGGIAYLEDGVPVCRPKHHRAVHLDSLPPVNRRLYNLAMYPHHSMTGSRGCPFSCAFCCNYLGSLSGRRAGRRDHARVIDEMIQLRDEYAAREIFFVDDIFLLKRLDAIEFCKQVIARRVGVSWIGQMRVDLIDDELASLMAEAKCRRVYLGLEAGSDAILERARKGLNTTAIRKGVRSVKAAGLRVKTGWIYGLPGSVEEQYASIPLMLALRPHEISIHQLIPFPGTVYYDQAASHGIRIRDPKNFESFCYGGLDGNIGFDYLSERQLRDLFQDTASALESDGYVSSDAATPKDEYIYSTPLNGMSMTVFRQRVVGERP